MDSDTLKRRYAQGKRDFTWADLAGADLAGTMLSDIDLSRANLAGANLRATDLRRANLTKANLRGADLRGANLAGAILRRTDLTDAHIQPQQLDQVDWYGAILPTDILQAMAGAPETPSDQHHGASWSARSTEAARPTPTAAVSPSAPPIIPANPARRVPNAQDWRELGRSLGLLAAGHLAYGTVLGASQASLGGLLLVGLPLVVGLIQGEWVWFVPPLEAVAVAVSLGISLGALIFWLPTVVAIAVGLSVCGSILGWSWGRTLQTTVWFGVLLLPLFLGATGLLDGSAAYSGGGVVLRLSALPRAGLLLGGLLAVGRGCLAYGLLNDLRLPRPWVYVLGSGWVGLAVGWWAGGLAG